MDNRYWFTMDIDVHPYTKQLIGLIGGERSDIEGVDEGGLQLHALVTSVL